MEQQHSNGKKVSTQEAGHPTEIESRPVSFPAIAVKVKLAKEKKGEKKQSIEEKHMFSAQCFAVSVAEVH